jgi:hypothetical protein
MDNSKTSKEAHLTVADLINALESMDRTAHVWISGFDCFDRVISVSLHPAADYLGEPKPFVVIDGG